MTIEITHQVGLGKVHDDALKIRKAVFVAEQGVSLVDEIDTPSNEESARHFVAYVDGTLAATARALEEEPGVWHIQRVATLYPLRGKGLGANLIAFIENTATNYDIHTLYLGAQIQAKGFYERLGFSAYGDEFLDAGIWHVHMKKSC
ncbi:GNAT family N-acetyltransferase [Leuconostoc carnosum]|uniref:GNAT family N-acetyltransferase n=1 Tax=Leuconostoc carnosum TaxID=1252 RepID=UPI00345CB98B